MLRRPAITTEKVAAGRELIPNTNSTDAGVQTHEFVEGFGDSSRLCNTLQNVQTCAWLKYLMQQSLYPASAGDAHSIEYHKGQLEIQHHLSFNHAMLLCRWFMSAWRANRTEIALVSSACNTLSTCCRRMSMVSATNARCKAKLAQSYPGMACTSPKRCAGSMKGFFWDRRLSMQASGEPLPCRWMEKAVACTA